MTEYKGKFVSLEGPEGSGKTTQAKLLCDYFTNQGKEVVKTREPGGVILSEQIRDILLNTKNYIFPRTELLLYASGRAQHTEELIIPSLKQGKYVVCERYSHASYAYQGYARGLGLELVKNVDLFATEGLRPDITIIIDIEIEKGLQRVKQSNRNLDRLESEDLAFHKKVRQGYLDIASKEPDVFVVDGEMEIDTTHNNILDIIKERGV